MTEAEWLASDNPGRLFEQVDGRVSARKVRLALCGCLRSPQVRALLTSKASRRAVEVGEAFVEGAANLQELAEARTNANAAARRAWRKATSGLPAAYLANHVCLQDNNLLSYAYPLFSNYLRQLHPPAGLIRDVLGNPFQPPTKPSAWLVPSVVSIAQAAYEERALPSGELDVARLAVLSDALEEAGCSDDILTHLRGPVPHVRGCWALDLLLGKG